MVATVTQAAEQAARHEVRLQVLKATNQCK